MPPRRSVNLLKDLIQYDPTKDGDAIEIAKILKEQDELNCLQVEVKDKEQEQEEEEEDVTNEHVTNANTNLVLKQATLQPEQEIWGKTVPPAGSSSSSSNSNVSTTSSLDIPLHSYSVMIQDDHTTQGRKMILVPESEIDFLLELKSDGYSYEPGDSEHDVIQKYLRNEHCNEIRRGLNSITSKKSNELKEHLLQFTSQAAQQCIQSVNELHREKGFVTFVIHHPTPKPRLTKGNLNTVVTNVMERNFQQMNPEKRRLLGQQIVEGMWQSSAVCDNKPVLHVTFEHKEQMRREKQRAKAQGISYIPNSIYGADYDNENDNDDVYIPKSMPNSISKSMVSKKRDRDDMSTSNTPNIPPTNNNNAPTKKLTLDRATTLAPPLSTKHNQPQPKPQQQPKLPLSKIPKLNPLPTLPSLSSIMY